MQFCLSHNYKPHIKSLIILYYVHILHVKYVFFIYTDWQSYSFAGDDGKMPPENAGLQKESENVYTLWCSGRINVEGMLVELKFIKVRIRIISYTTVNIYG